jgi:hypothetical protein
MFELSVHGFERVETNEQRPAHNGKISDPATTLPS